jgi:hypothetical protein
MYGLRIIDLYEGFNGFALDREIWVAEQLTHRANITWEAQTGNPGERRLAHIFMGIGQ